SVVAFTIHETAAGPRLAHLSAEPAARVGRALVTLAEAGLVHRELGVGIPHDEIGVLAGRDRSLAAVEPGEPRARGRQPFGHAVHADAARGGAAPHRPH